MSGDCGLRNACTPMRHFVAEVLAQCNVLQHSTPLLQRSAVCACRSTRHLRPKCSRK
jgi:hypothetical protein